MDGWVNDPTANESGDYLAWSQYQRADIPGFWDLASSYALADHFHASMLGPSFPGHTFVLAAQAGGAYDNPTWSLPLLLWGCDDPSGTTVPVQDPSTCQTTNPAPCFTVPSAPDLLPVGTTWKFYGTGINLGVGSVVWSMFDAINNVRNGPGWQNVVTYDQYETDLANGTLPNVSWLVDQDLDSGHPPLSMCSSVTWATTRVNELMASSAWSTSAVIVTWDDFGGFVDHVPPPVQYGCDPAHPYGQGFRLPAILVSPWVKPGVFHGQTEQASIPRLIEELFGASNAVGGLHALDPQARDDVAGSLLPAFDFHQTPLPAVPGKETCP